MVLGSSPLQDVVEMQSVLVGEVSDKPGGN